MKLYKSQLAPYLELNGADTSDLLNPVKDIIRQLVIAPPNWQDCEAVRTALVELTASRSIPIQGDICLHAGGIARLTTRLIHSLDDKTREYYPRVVKCVTQAELVNLAGGHTMQPGSFILATKNYPDIFCDSGKWYTLAYDAESTIFEIVVR